MKLSDYVAQFLRKKGVRYVFGYQGGSITHLIDSVYKTDGLEYIQNYHEQGSAMAADAYGRIAEEGIGVAIASNGPGATNLLTGIANAYCDSVPAMFITGQVHTYAMKKNGVRQESFQEIDILSMAKPVTKYCVTVMKPEEICYELEKAYYIATTGRKGPVLVDIPVDVQGMDIEPDKCRQYETEVEMEYELDEDIIEKVKELLNSSERPVILVGGGVRQSGAARAVKSFAEKYDLPVVASLQGLDVLPHSSSSFVGFIGGYGNRAANIVLQNADVVLILGSRVDFRQTGKNVAGFIKNSKIIHVDIDRSELEHKLPKAVNVQCDIGEFMKSLEKCNLNRHDKWLQKVSELKRQFTDINSEWDWKKYGYILTDIGKCISKPTVVVADVGQNQMWVAKYLRAASEEFRLLNSGGLGAMGYSLPGCIGAYYANPDYHIVGIMGDGGLQMNIQELGVIGGRQLPVTVIVLNNHSLGMIRDVHEKYYDKRYAGSVWGFEMPQLSRVAQAYNINYLYVDNADMSNVLKAVESRKPYIIEINMNEETYISPELVGMKSIDDMQPELRAEEKQCIMNLLN